MEKIRTFELDRWSEPDEQHRVRYIGMADAKETFEKLETHLKEKGMLPGAAISTLVSRIFCAVVVIYKLRRTKIHDCDAFPSIPCTHEFSVKVTNDNLGIWYSLQSSSISMLYLSRSPKRYF